MYDFIHVTLRIKIRLCIYSIYVYMYIAVTDTDGCILRCMLHSKTNGFLLCHRPTDRWLPVVSREV